MGNVIDKCLGLERSERKINLLLVGLDNAGKTKTANNLTGQSNRDVCPTVGFKAFNLVHRKYPVVIYDLGGGSGIRGIWEQYYSDVHGVIFVVDSTDLNRLDECREVLRAVLSHEKIAGKPVLILANKQDKEGALGDADLVERLDIETVVNRFRCPTRVESYTAAPADENLKHRRAAVMDPGLQNGYTWLLNYIIHRYGDLNLRVQTDINAEKTRRSLKMKQIEMTPTDQVATSFENPNYMTQIDLNNASTSPEGVIMVKEATSNKSIDYDAIEVANIEEDRAVDNEKISSLFGDKLLENGTGDKPIELEARVSVRKLSPIVRGRFTVTAYHNESVRPQTSPLNSTKKETVGDHVSAGHGSSLERLSPVPSDGRNVLRQTRKVDVGLVEPDILVGPLSGRRQVLPPIGKIDNNNILSSNVRDSPPSWNSPRSNTATPTRQTQQSPSPLILQPSNLGRDAKSSSRESSELEDNRPRSATQGVREQLEQTKETLRKLSIKSLKRNRTSPEIKSSLFAYDPTISDTLVKNHQNSEDGEFSSQTKNFGRVGLRSDTIM